MADQVGPVITTKEGRQRYFDRNKIKVTTTNNTRLARSHRHDIILLSNNSAYYINYVDSRTVRNVCG